MAFTLEQLLQAAPQLCEDMTIIKRQLLEKNKELQSEPDHWFDLNQLVEYDPEERAKSTFYGYTRAKTVPFHKRGKKLLFLKSEIDNWLIEGRKDTSAELTGKVDTYIRRHKKRVKDK
jgi:hypothetical protein